ncbi:MAG: phosphohydrolase, partial [Massilia sp.]
GAGVDMAGRDFDRYTAAQREAVVAAYPRGPSFGQDVIDTFYAGLQHRPATTFGSFNDDFLAWKDPAFKRGNLCCSILGSRWHDRPAHGVSAPAGKAANGD